MLDFVHAPTENVSQPAWRSMMPAAGVISIGLLHWGGARALDLNVIEDILARAGRQVGPQALKLAFVDLQLPYHGPAMDVLVLADRLEGHADQLFDGPLRHLLQRATAVVLLGDGVRWFAGTQWSKGIRLALHWRDAVCLQAEGDAILSTSIIEVQGKWTTCCGGAATMDLGMAFVLDVFGTEVARQVQEELCLDRVREPGVRQRLPLRSQFGELVPRLSEAVSLMEANIEEPLMTDDIATLVGLSKRQLERLFKKHLDTVPSRYYMELRLNRARVLVREVRHSLLEIALICGFSSGSHFSSSYNALFGITPREERHRVLGRATQN